MEQQLAGIESRYSWLSAEQLARLARYADELLRWNARIQLTATRDGATFVDRHICDALEIAARIPPVGSLVDVGSGGGLPGVVLALCRPELQVDLLEPVRKKHAFLAHIRRTLRLENVRALAERDDEYCTRPGFEPRGAAIARAVWSLSEWLERGRGLVEPGGWVLGLEARERAALPVGAERHHYGLPDGRERALVMWRVPQ